MKLLAIGKSAVLVSLLVVLIGPYQNAYAVFPKEEADFRYLPPYCKARLKEPKGSPIKKKWEGILRGGFLHIHHYCAGLFTTNIADQKVSREAREELLGQVVKEYEYIQKHADPGFILLPEIAVKKGKVLFRLGRYAEAVKEYQDSIRMKKDYAPPYAALSDYYKSINDMENARKILDEGLAHSSKSKMLKRRVRELEKLNTTSN